MIYYLLPLIYTLEEIAGSGLFISSLVSKKATEESSEKISELETALYNCGNISTGSCFNVTVTCPDLNQTYIPEGCQSDLEGCIGNLVGCLEGYYL